MQRYALFYDSKEDMQHISANSKGGWVRYAEAQAEIARLTAERDEAMKLAAAANIMALELRVVEGQRDQARAQIAAVIEKIAAWHDENAAHDQGGIDYSDLVGISICNRYELEQSVKAHTGSARYVRALTPTDAQQALNQMLNEAYKAGQRDMRKRAASATALGFHPKEVNSLPIKERNE